tara:strand:- start:59925 stop:60932 length:1008 start_codon:yes stop_codon:yes gene_type:complete
MILVTGGTGLVGSHLLYFLLKENNSVRAIHRNTSDLQAVKKVFSYYTEASEEIFKKIEWIEADITDIPALTLAFKDIMYVYHAAAYISFDPKHYRKLKKANIEGTANVVNLCIQNKIKKLCYVSSIATLGKSENGSLVNEATQWNPEEDHNVYSITKYGAEMEVWRGTQEGVDAVIVNPGIIFGSGYWNSGSGVIVKMANKQIPFYTSGGSGIVDVKDVVSIMIKLMKSEIVNKNYILVSKNISHKELLSELAMLLQKNPPRNYISKWILVLFTKIDWFLNKIFGTKRKLLRATVDSLYNQSFYDTTRVKTDLNISFTPYKETLERVSLNYSKES